jgi:hypothetical protein
MSIIGVRVASRPATLVVWAFVAGLWGVPTLARAQEGQFPDKIREALEANVKSLSPLTLTWERTRASDLPVARLLPTLKRQPTELDFMTPVKTRFRWQGGQFLLLYTTSRPQVKEVGGNWVLDPDRPLAEMKQEISFDGEAIYNGNPNPDQPVITIDKIERTASIMANVAMTRQDYLREAGYILPDFPPELRDKQPPRSALLGLIGGGAKVIRVGQEPIDGAPMATVELQSGDQQIRFYLDPAMNYAIRRREARLKSGELAQLSNCTEFTRLARSGLWLPKRIEVTWNWRPEAPTLVKPRLLTETYKVSELSDDPIPESEFVLKYEKPGSLIADSRLGGAEKAPGGRISYQQPAEPSDLEDVIASASGKYTPRSRWSSLRLVLLANGALLVVVALVVLRKRRRGA